MVEFVGHSFRKMSGTRAKRARTLESHVGRKESDTRGEIGSGRSIAPAAPLKRRADEARVFPPSARGLPRAVELGEVEEGVCAVLDVLSKHIDRAAIKLAEIFRRTYADSGRPSVKRRRGSGSHRVVRSMVS
jgi:hypothetical protein